MNQTFAWQGGVPAIEEDVLEKPEDAIAVYKKVLAIEPAHDPRPRSRATP